MFGEQLFKINIHSLELTPLTEEGFLYIDPSPAPNGKHIVYTPLLHPVIIILNIDPSREIVEELLITYPPGTPQVDIPGQVTPSWLPDSENLVFAWAKDGDAEIYTININDKTTRQLTNNNALDFEPDWWSSDDYNEQ